MKIFSLINRFVFESLQMRIMLVILIFLFIPVILVSNYNFAQAETILQGKTSRLIQDNLEQIGNKVENICLDIMKISSISGTDSVIVSTLSQVDDVTKINNREKDMYRLSSIDNERISKIENRINYVKSNFFNYNTHVIIFGSDGILYSSLDNIMDDFKFKTEYIKEFRSQEWYKTLKSGEQTGIWTAPFTYNTDTSGKEERFISLSRIIRSNYTQDIIGMIMVNFNEYNFRQMIGSNVNGVISLLNKDNGTIFSSDTARPEQQVIYGNAYEKVPANGTGYFFSEIEKNKYMVNYYSIERLGWKLVSIIPYDEVMAEIRTLKLETYTINFVVFGIFLLISAGLILYITYPLKKLISNIRKVKIGDYSIGLGKNQRFDDVSGIVNSFDYMFKRIEELVKTVIEEQKLEHEFKYEALRAQINPHFLFNTLNTIKWSAMMSGASNVSKMITSLGMLLEISMNKGEDEITFREEFELVNSYIYIQNIRYNDKFTLEFKVQEEIHDYKVPKLILQPIVENSVIHGLKDKASEEHITINAYKQENGIRIDVLDNGKGMSKEKMEQILSENGNHYTKQKFSGIGLRNVHERIKLKYGREYGLEIYSEEGNGTKISLLLPVLL